MTMLSTNLDTTSRHSHFGSLRGRRAAAARSIHNSIVEVHYRAPNAPV